MGEKKNVMCTRYGLMACIDFDIRCTMNFIRPPNTGEQFTILFFNFDKFSVFSFDRQICHSRGRKWFNCFCTKCTKNRIKNAHNIAHKTTQDRKTVAWNHSASSVYTLNYCETAESSWTPIRWLRRRRWRPLHAHIDIRHTRARTLTHTQTHTFTRNSWLHRTEWGTHRRVWVCVHRAVCSIQNGLGFKAQTTFTSIEVSTVIRWVKRILNHT